MNKRDVLKVAAAGFVLGCCCMIMKYKGAH